MWPLIFNLNLEIYFAYLPFLWSNNAKSNAGVSVTIIGIRRKTEQKKILISKDLKSFVNNINAYLTSGDDLIVTQRLNSLSGLPQMITGNSPYENNNLRFDSSEKEKYNKSVPASWCFNKENTWTMNLNNTEKWCFWITAN